MKGVIIAAGTGTRLRPLTYITNKHLLPIYNKPMIAYPIQTFKGMGITEILIISCGENIGQFAAYLKDGGDFGVKINFMVQSVMGGIAQALSLAEKYVDGKFAVILGDNIFEYTPEFPEDADFVFFTQKTDKPEAFGIYDGKRIIEKPKIFIGDQAQLGLYIYTPKVFEYIKNQKPSARGELEITDLNNWCLENMKKPTRIEYKGKWFDAGTFDSLLECANWAKENAKN